MRPIDADKLKEVVNADINRCYSLGIGTVGPLSHFLDQIDEQPTIGTAPEATNQSTEIATCKCGERPIFDRFPRHDEYYTLRLCCPKCGTSTRSRRCAAIAGDISERNFMVAEWNEMQNGED